MDTDREAEPAVDDESGEPFALDADGDAGYAGGDFAVTSVFDDELAGVDADDWNLDADLIWGGEQMSDGPSPDFDLPLM